jgi:outer membrane protein TolC
VSWSLGLALDLPVNRLPERNAYRSALITWQRSARDADLARDNIEVALRDDLRNLTARRESFAIQENAVALAAQRVESSELNQKAGRASTRDLLEAQSALVSSQNALTRALIDYTLARLTMVLDMGLLRVTEDGISIENYTGAAVFPSEISLPTGEAITE